MPRAARSQRVFLRGAFHALGLVFVVGSLGFARVSSAAEESGEPWRSGIVAGSVGVAYISLGLVDESYGTKGCRLCESNALDRGARNALVWDHPRTAAHISDGLLIGIPLTSVGAAFLVGERESTRQGVTDALVAVEAIAMAGLGTQMVKMSAARRRPFATYGTGTYESSVDENRSFWSGHTATTFAAVASVSTIAYQHGWSSYPYLAGVGTLVAGTTGYLRLGADKHWLTDVLAGGLFGTAVGIFVPMLELGRRRDGSHVGTTVMPLGVAGTF